MEVMNIPNILTLLRIFLVPVFTYLFLTGRYGEALCVYLFAGFTDFLDGWIARSFQQKTTFGAILDPAADKFLITVTFIALTVEGNIPLWLTALVIGRDLYIVSGVGILKKLKRKLYFHPTYLSKTNTFCQLSLILISFFLVYLHSEKPAFAQSFTSKLEQLRGYFIFLVAGMTIASGIQYTRIGVMILKGRISYADLPLKKS